MRNLVYAMVITGFIGLATSAQAASRFWYDQEVHEINVGEHFINSDSAAFPDILNTVVATCPSAGKLVANADATFGAVILVDSVGNYTPL